MNYASVVRLLAALALVLAGLMCLPWLVALSSGEWPQVFSLAMTIIVLVITSSMIILLTPKPKRRARAKDGLAVAILWWILAPIAAAPPFVLGAAEDSILPAIHEAASCLTTSGHSVISIGGEGWPQSLIVLRGVLHLMGAWMTMTIAATVFAAINLGGPGIHRTDLFNLSEGSFFEAAPRVATAALWVLSLTILAICPLLILLGEPPRAALSMTLSIATTGWVNPIMTAPALGFGAQAALLIGLIASTVGVSILLDVRRGQILRALSDPEWVTLVIVVLGVVAAAAAAGIALWPALLWGVSAVSTSGLPIDGAGVASRLPIGLLIVPALIGGSGLSAAGGIKLGRMFVLAKRAGQEFSRLSYPQSVTAFTFRGREQEENAVIGVWVYLIGYIIAVFSASLMLAFAGAQLEDAARISVGAFSNSAGLLVGATLSGASFEHAVITVCLILGRLEVLAILPALNPTFWRG